MTTKPRAKKFRIRRSVHSPATPKTPETPEDATPQARAPAIQPGAEAEIAQIRKEGLTGRQLRMARRIAQKHGLAPISDFDAVRLLRKKGIDPFQKLNMLELVVTEPARTSGDSVNLPQTVPAEAAPNLPSTDIVGSGKMADQVLQMQQDIARRRRRRSMLTLARLLVFVGLPTFAAGYYYYNIASPMYSTETQFLIQQAESQAGGLGGLFKGTTLANQGDSIAVQGYLQSRGAMRRLDEDLGFQAHFQQPWVDPVQRLPDDATMEDGYKLYKKRVKIGYDPTEGILRMDVTALDPENSQAFSEALVSYAEQEVDSLTQRAREDQMAGARESYLQAEANVADAQARVLDLQEKLGVLDPASEVGAVMGQISGFETQLREKRLQLDQLLDNATPNQARVSGVRGDIGRLEVLIAELRASMTETTQGADSLARVTAEMRIAEADLVNRQLLLQQALQQLETARIEANRQVRYLSLPVAPVAPDAPTYPRAFENTLLAFLIFAGIYLMVSITASVLREQVSA